MTPSEDAAREQLTGQRAARIVGILLAAGRAERFGGDKLLAPLSRACEDMPRGTPIGIAACRHLVDAVREVIAVIRPGAADLQRALAEVGARTVTCTAADQGMGASLACGVAAARNADGWVIALADMPWIRTDTIERIARAVAHGAPVVAPFFEARRGHPVGFGSALRDALLAVTGDEGAREIVRAHESTMLRIAVDDPGILRDVDRPSDL